MSVLNKIDGLLEYINQTSDSSNDGQPRFTLGYWKICGLANTARMMFVYANVTFNNVMYEQKGADQQYSRAEWLDVKHSKQLSFPNVPYLIDHQRNLRLTESDAINKYVARQLNIGVQCDPDLAVAEMVGGVIRDCMSMFGRLCYGQYPELKNAYIEQQLPPKLKYLELFMKDKEKFICGDSISCADFALYYMIFANSKLEPKIFDSCPSLQAFYRRFNVLPFMEKWKASENSKLPLNNTVAKFR